MLPTMGAYYDGEVSRRHHVNVALNQELQVLEIEGETIDAPLRWPFALLRAQNNHREEDNVLTLTLHEHRSDETQRSLSRLSITDAVLIENLQHSCPNLFKADVNSGTLKRVVTRASMAVAALLLMLFVILPSMANTLAALIPIEREIAFGKTVVSQMEMFLGADRIGDLRCTNTDGLRALDKMTTQLTENSDLEYDLEVSVFDSEMINAFAAPGGQIVIMRGLLETVSGPDAVAAVLAHEIGHVENRDATKNSLRAAGSAGLLAMVLGDIGGGSLLAVLADHTLQASYSREAEEDADIFAIEMLNKAEIGTNGMAAFFDQLTQLESTVAKYLPGYLWTHPTTDARANRARENARIYPMGTPVLSQSEWDALGSICE